MKNPFKTGRFFVADRGIEHAGGHECLLSGPHMDSDTANQLKRAFKRATSWYDQEVQKGKDGLSSYEVAKRVKVNLVVLVHLPEPFNDTPTVALQDYRH